jgi:hypothetical protein
MIKDTVIRLYPTDETNFGEIYKVFLMFDLLKY